MRTTLFLSSLLLLASACRDGELTAGKPFARTSTTADTSPSTAGPETPIAYDETRPAGAAPTEDTTRVTGTPVADPWESPAKMPETPIAVATTEPAPAKPSAPVTSSRGPVWIETTCEEASVEAQLTQIKENNASAREVSVGKAGVIVDEGNRQHLTAWDTDSNCHVDVTAPKDVDTVSIARTVLSQLPGRG
ncbi:MAG: hypothetical protein H0T46_34810 [Deltaproteobacteria bacterium]|nr:hypothetical protein [Deltaproteobacteria bacterium]